jgi:hypothetical protein
VPNDGQNPIARQDELLEMMFWLEGEKIPGAATVTGMARFLTYSDDDVRDVLERLIERGDVDRPDATDGEYRLTETGRREAARRFAEEFAPMLAQGHGECNDPNCDCQTSPGGAAECHARASGHRH